MVQICNPALLLQDEKQQKAEDQPEVPSPARLQCKERQKQEKTLFCLNKVKGETNSQKLFSDFLVYTMPYTHL